MDRNLPTTLPAFSIKIGQSSVALDSDTVRFVEGHCCQGGQPINILQNIVVFDGEFPENRMKRFQSIQAFQSTVVTYLQPIAAHAGQAGQPGETRYILPFDPQFAGHVVTRPVI